MTHEVGIQHNHWPPRDPAIWPPAETGGPTCSQIYTVQLPHLLLTCCCRLHYWASRIPVSHFNFNFNFTPPHSSASTHCLCHRWTLLESFIQLFQRTLSVTEALNSPLKSHRPIQEIDRVLVTLYGNIQEDWSWFLPWRKYTQNSLYKPHPTHSHSVCAGIPVPAIPWNTNHPMDSPAVDDWFKDKLTSVGKYTSKFGTCSVSNIKNTNQHWGENTHNPPRDRVWLATKDFHQTQACTFNQTLLFVMTLTQ